MKKKIIILLGFLFFFFVLACFIAYKSVVKTCYRFHTSKCYENKILYKRKLIIDKYNPDIVEFHSLDGTRLVGFLIDRPHSKNVVLLCHGYRCSKEYMKHFIKFFPKESIFLFDFRSHGQSEGNIISMGYFEQEDVQAAVKFLQSNEKTKDKNIIGLGHSMGAASLLECAAQDNSFVGLIVDSSFARLYEQIICSFSQKTGLPPMPFMPIAKKIFEYIAQYAVSEVNPVESAKKVMCPVLVIHSEDDEMIPVLDAKEIYNNLPGTKDLWLVSGPCHNRVAKEFKKEYKEKIDAFLDVINSQQ